MTWVTIGEEEIEAEDLLRWLALPLNVLCVFCRKHGSERNQIDLISVFATSTSGTGGEEDRRNRRSSACTCAGTGEVEVSRKGGRFGFFFPFFGWAPHHRETNRRSLRRRCALPEKEGRRHCHRPFAAEGRRTEVAATIGSGC